MWQWSLDWRFGSAIVRAAAGILWDCEFVLRSGRRFKPLARAPWAEDANAAPGQPAHIRYLGGEFACVPFGIGGEPAELLPQWQSAAWRHFNPAPHGYSADQEWHAVSADSGSLLLRLDYPLEDDIEFLTRRISVDNSAPALELELTIHARRPTRQPVGLHPILKLPERPNRLQLQAQFEFGMSYPANVYPGLSRVARGVRFDRLDSIPGLKSGTVDYARLPKEGPTEEMLTLCNVRGPVVARFLDENALLRVSWDTSVLPSCLLWPSDCSIADPPWNRSFRGLGVEPIAAVFDAARPVALQSNPLNEAGVKTAVEIQPDKPVSIRYRLEAADA